MKSTGSTVDPKEALYKEISVGSTSNVRKLLNNHSYLLDEPLDKNGSTPLILAVKEKKVAIVQLLLDQKASLEKPDCLGNNPIYGQFYFVILKS